jgi:hypothetical protein
MPPKMPSNESEVPTLSRRWAQACLPKFRLMGPWDVRARPDACLMTPGRERARRQIGQAIFNA